jgi:hypothetical protein
MAAELMESKLGLKMTVNFIETVNKDKGTTLYVFDLFYAIEEHMLNTLRYLYPEENSSFNLKEIRKYLVIALTGNVEDDDQYAEAILNIYDKSPLFQKYVNYMYVLHDGKFDIIRDVIRPCSIYVNSYSILLQNIVGGVYRCEHGGHIFIDNPRSTGGNPYVKVWGAQNPNR